MSSPVCLSVVPILRCIGLSRLENALLLIPVGLEVIFSTGIIIAGRGQGWRRLILALEGPVYLLLAVLDVLTHVVPTFQTSLSSFKSLDIFIGAASFVPILLFTSFLYLFKRAEFFPAFPKRFTFVANLFAVVVIPFILAANEIGSFIGNTYAVLQFASIPPAPPSPPQFAIGSHNQAAETARAFFSSLALALMAVYSVITFLVFFVRLSGAFISQRRIEDAGGMQEETYLFKGTGWVALGMTLSTAESLAGFASGSFGLFFTRRLLRMLGRASMAIGVIKGPDRHLQFDMVDNEKPSSKRKSTMRLKIGAPLLVDSSRRISQLIGIDLSRNRGSMQSDTAVGTAPLAGAFIRPSEDIGRNGIPFPTDKFPIPPPLSAAPDIVSVTSSQRVTVYQRRGRAPTLILRLSDNNLPSPSAIMGTTRSARSSTYSFRRDDQENDVPWQQTETDHPSSPASIYSAGKSLVENFKTQAFPNRGASPIGLPSNPRVRPKVEGESLQVPPPAAAGETRTSYIKRGPQQVENAIPPLNIELQLPRRLSKRKPAPNPRASTYLDRSNFISPITPGDSAQLPPIPDSARQRARSTASTFSSPRPGEGRESFMMYGSPDTVASTDWMPPVPRQKRPLTMSAMAINMVDPARAHSLRYRSAEIQRPPSLVASPVDQRVLGHESQTINFDWISNPDIQTENEEAAAFEPRRMARARRSSQVLLSSPALPPMSRTSRSPGTTRPPGPGRHVSIGTVSQRQTPVPSPAVATRASVNVEQLITSEREDGDSKNVSMRQEIARQTISETASVASSRTLSSWSPRKADGVISLNGTQLAERYGEMF